MFILVDLWLFPAPRTQATFRSPSPLGIRLAQPLFLYKNSKTFADLSETGESGVWEMVVKSDGKQFCSTSTFSGLTRGAKKIISSGELGKCGRSDRKLDVRDFQAMETLSIELRPKAECFVQLQSFYEFD